MDRAALADLEAPPSLEAPLLTEKPAPMEEEEETEPLACRVADGVVTALSVVVALFICVVYFLVAVFLCSVLLLSLLSLLMNSMALIGVSYRLAMADLRERHGHKGDCDTALCVLACDLLFVADPPWSDLFG